MLDNKRRKSLVLVQGVVNDSLFDAFKKRKEKNIVVLEGRPKLKAAKVLSRALLKRKITPTLIADNMAGFLFYRDLVKEVWVAYQLADKNGAVCDIGGLVLAVLGSTHKVPVYLYPTAEKTPLMGKQEDVLKFNGVRVAPKNVSAYVPLVEWVPKKYISKVYSNGSGN